MIGLHEGDAAYNVNPIRGAQFYPNCVQIEVVGNGTVSLPDGVSFPRRLQVQRPRYRLRCKYSLVLHSPSLAYIRVNVPLTAAKILDLLLDQDYVPHEVVHHDLSDPRSDGMVRSMGGDHLRRARRGQRGHDGDKMEQLDPEIRCYECDIRRELRGGSGYINLPGGVVDGISDTGAKCGDNDVDRKGSLGKCLTL